MPCVTYSSPHTFSNALSPAQAAVASACLGIITSKDGDALRARLMANILHWRQRLDQGGLQTYGAPLPIVCVPMGSERLARHCPTISPFLLSI
ncbi:MAG: hypothetical protein PW845_05260 [Pseudomonas sp.]|uniref:hypothetical protein n=1 Tax=Pseudomonas abieticivorans TaxID=2931382 RepID=UPI0020BD85B7|nr:hypothetical protein [Pseudomonas sp. PIA16]MDE1164796.1 hypothetical protein [Pseudomonas sp.]